MANFDVIVLGSGPGGYVTAIRASQLGLKTAIIEKESLGGVCLNWGCIPTKALLKSAQVFEYLKHAGDYGLKADGVDKDFDAVVKRSRSVADGMSKGVQFLMKKNKIEVIKGFGTLKPGKKVSVKDADGKEAEHSAEHIIIATGARSRELPSLPQDGKKIIGYREAMTLKSQPKKLVVVGSGAIGIEFAYFYNAMGSEVTVVEFLPNIVPVEDEDVSKQLARTFKKSGINVMTNSSVESVDTKGAGCKVKVKTKKGEMQFGGVIYNDSADKSTRFIANCNQKKIPLVFLQDVTGFMVGSKSEHGGIIKDGAKMVNAVSNSVVPKFTIIIGNSYGAGNYAMCGKAYDPRLIAAWPSAELAVMSGNSAAKVLLQIETASLKKKGEEITPEKEAELFDKIKSRYDNQISPYYAAARIWTDAVINPLDTRTWISMGIEAANHAPIEKPFNMGVLQV